MMNIDTSNNCLNVASPIGDKSTLIVGERCTSTPNDPDKLFTLRPCYDESAYTAQKRLRFPPELENAPEPIFGFFNFRPVIENKRGSENQINDELIMKINYKSIDEKLETLSSDYEWDIIGKDKQKDSPKVLVNKKNCITQKSHRKSSIYSKPKRRSGQNKNQKAVFKVVPKRPKSPKLLTAMRAKVRQNRERISMGNKLSDNRSSKTLVNVNRRTSNKGKITLKSNTIPMTKKENTKKQSQLKEHTTRYVNLTNKKKSNKDDQVKLIPFKAQPIRKYAPLPVVKSRSVTIPQSPKLGKRRTNAALSH